MTMELLFQREECSKMELLKIRTGGFKNIEDTTLDLSDLTALVSLNSYGKSNLLTAIDFGIKFITGSAKEKSQMMCFQSGIPMNRNNALRNYFFEFEAETTLNDQLYRISYRYEFQWRKKGKAPQRLYQSIWKLKGEKKVRDMDG